MALAGLLPVRGLALLASVGLRPHRGYRSVPVPKLLGPLSGWPLLGPALVSSSQRAMVRLGFSRHTTPAEVARTLRQLGRFDFAAHAARVRALSVPTMLAWADDDPMVEAEISVELAAACPEGPRLAFKEGGHNIQKSQAAALAEAVLGF